MKKMLTLLLLLCMFKMHPQAETEGFSRPDFALIEKNVNDKNSPYHYKTLLTRYHAADSTLTLEELRHLYYGYSFQDDYSPYERSRTYDKLNDILKQESADKADLEKVLKYTDEILREYPFSLRMKEYRIYCLKELGRIEEADKESLQASMIIDAILSTGDGTSKDKCFYVINTTNEYELLNVLGFEFGGEQSLVEHKYDYLSLAENSYNLPGFYFDVSRCLDSLKF